MEANEFNQNGEARDLHSDNQKSEAQSFESNNGNSYPEETPSKKDEDMKEQTYQDKKINVKPDYSKLSREELLQKIQQLVKEKSASEIKDDVREIKDSFDRATSFINNEAKKEFIESGEPEELFVPKPDDVQKDFNEALNIYRNKRNEEKALVEQKKEENLKAKYEVIEGIKDLLNRRESLNETFQEFRVLQQKWKEIGPVPQKEVHDMWETYHLHVENFYNYIKINKELRDLDLKKNLEAKTELCEKAEALLEEESAVKAFKTLQRYHDLWREIGPVHKEKKEDLWNRFKAATTKINQRQQEHFEALKHQLQKNLEAKTELCEKAEAILAKEIKSPREWEQQSKELIDLQQIWKTIGFTPKKDNNAIYQRFRKSCDTFFDQKRTFFKNYKEEQQKNLQQKTALCEKAEEMKESTDWKRATETYIKIQKEWKEIGPVPRKQSDIVWKRFREACDHFFSRKKDFFSHIDEAQTDNLKKKEKLIEELKEFEAQNDSEKCFEALQEYQRRWDEIGFVPIKEKDRINQEFRNLINQKFDHLNLDEVNKNLQKFRNKLENWKAAGQLNEKIDHERNKIITKLKQLENDIILWENNIGFFNTSNKNSEALIRDFKNKIDNGKRNIKLLNRKLDLIEEMI
ncbi:DUF349 domain-containing protein [Marinilabiliaceae bacterium ANBcel2]|nr:DUF349 domain-containing protein [Marinilabiliaceae bacterium ANBcel2]